jgi:DNA repair protein RadB
MKVSSGIEVIDDLLKGGFETEVINTIYGPSATGKTNISMLFALKIAKTKRVIYIDTEGNSNQTRLLQLTKDKSLLDNILILKPTNFTEQKEIFNKLKDLATEKIGLIIVDTISMLYRVSFSSKKDMYEINKQLGKQLSYLLEIARKKKIPCLVIAQVYNDFEEKGKMIIVGGEIIKYSSKVMIELIDNNNGSRTAHLRKHPHLPPRKTVFKIVQKGIEKIRKGFLLN